MIAMRIIQNDLTLKCVKITGPTHHFLGIEFSIDKPSSILIENIDNHRSSNMEDHIKTLCFCIANINHPLSIGSKYFLKRIIFSVNDRPSKMIYTELLNTLFFEAENIFTIK